MRSSRRKTCTSSLPRTWARMRLESAPLGWRGAAGGGLRLRRLRASGLVPRRAGRSHRRRCRRAPAAAGCGGGFVELGVGRARRVLFGVGDAERADHHILPFRFGDGGEELADGFFRAGEGDFERQRAGDIGWPGFECAAFLLGQERAVEVPEFGGTGLRRGRASGC